LCTGDSAWTTAAVERLGVPQMLVSDGPHGVRRVLDGKSMMMDSLPATCFPTASCLASSWDVDLLRELGEALAEECIALDVDVVLGPGVNMKRSPLGGRNFEYFSEDPYLAGEMAVSLIGAIQGKGVGTSIKHFAANNQEFQRFNINAEVDERTLHELYLPAFETAVKRTQPWTVMCAYNKLNGSYCSEHHELLVDILKNKWGFEGLVVSDWGAVHDRVASLKGGLDLEMPGPQDHRVQAVVDAVRAGELDENVVDEAVRRILNIVFKAKETPKGGEFDVDAHHALARKIAGEGMVLLKNNGILPLNSQQHIAVIGQAAKKAHFQGGGSSHIKPTKVAVPFKELQELAGEAELSFAEGYPSGDAFQQELIDEAVALAQTADVALLYIALPTIKESEGYDRRDLDLTEQQIALIKGVAQVQSNTVVILNNGAPVAMSGWIDDVAAVLEGWMMGQAGGGAIADILFGEVNPSGKLAETFPLKVADTPAHVNWPGEAGVVRYGEGIFIGYRYYDAKEMPVLFPFGHGLSYTSFALNFFGARTVRLGYDNEHYDLRPFDAQQFSRHIDHLLNRYEWEISLAQLNLLGSHDTARALWLMGEDKTALRLATLFQMTMPGAPCIYYGDELGLSAETDPYCREAFPWHLPERWDEDLRAFFQEATALRHSHPVLRTGSYEPLHAQDGLFAFRRVLDEEEAVVLFNTTTAGTTISIELPASAAKSYKQIRPSDTMEALHVDQGTLTINLPKREAVVLISQT
jgi:beta-glucosidase